MPGKTPTVSGSRRHKTTLAPDRLEPQTAKAETAVHPGLVARKERMRWAPWGFNWPPLRCFCYFSLQPLGLEVPNPSFPCLLSQLSTLFGLWVTGQGWNWPFPGLGDPRGILHLCLEFAHSYKHPCVCRCLSSQLRRERGSGRPGKALENLGLS